MTLVSERKYCTHCGARLAEGALYCSRCGTPVPLATAAPPAGPTTVPPPPPSYSYEKQEKHEKHEKGEKSEKHEKAEKGGRSGWVSPAFGGSIVIWLGITLLLEVSGTIAGPLAWLRWFLAGLGILLVLEGLVLSAARGRAYPFVGFFIGGIAVFLVGLFLIGVAPYTIIAASALWPLLIIALGIIIIIAVLFGRRRVPPP